MTTHKDIALMREFALHLEQNDDIQSAWVDDWNDYNGFNLGISVPVITPHSTNRIKAILRAAMGFERFWNVQVNVDLYNAPKKIRDRYSIRTEYTQEYWMFDVFCESA